MRIVLREIRRMPPLLGDTVAGDRHGNKKGQPPVLVLIGWGFRVFRRLPGSCQGNRRSSSATVLTL